MGDALQVEEQRSLLSARSCMPPPDVINKLIKRIKVKTRKLLPVEVKQDDITDADSSIITPDVIREYAKCGGKYSEAVPFCLLRAKASFHRDALYHPTNYDEAECRATACEVLARRIIHNLGQDRLESVMSTRYRYQQVDGDISAPVSALETAIDQQAIIFLSSAESQHAINALWDGDWIQVYQEDDQVDFVHYEKAGSTSFWDHMDPHRLAVPKYQTAFSIFVWLFFLFVYSQAVRTPLESQSLSMPDKWEFILYIMALAFFIDEVTKTWKALRLSSKPWNTVNFWTVVNFLTDCLLLSAFALRIISIRIQDDKESEYWHLKAFQVLACVAPLIWMKLLTVFDNFKVIGVLQIVTFRMIRDSAIFFILLAVLGAGFAQSLLALDAADGEANNSNIVFNGLLQALLGSPDFDTPSERFGYPFGLIIYYVWNLLTTVILLNVLIALFGSSYSNVEDQSTDYYLAFFAEKTVSLIRSPDTYLYPPPFNLIEIFLILPTEWILSRSAYDKLNRVVMSTVFFVPLLIIALFEATTNDKGNKRLRLYLGEDSEEEDDDPNDNDFMDEEDNTSRPSSSTKASSIASKPAAGNHGASSSSSSPDQDQTSEREEELKENIAEVLKEIDEAYDGAGMSRAAKKPRLVAVSKLKPASDIRALYDAGYRHFGENYIQEMVDKAKELPDDINWHFIGNLQSNKAKVAAAIPNLFVLETLSSAKTALALNKARKSHSLPPLGVYIQINTSSEDSKSGVPALSADAKDAEAELVSVAKTILEECGSLELKGLMTIGSYDASHDPSKPNPDFASLKATRTALLSILKEAGVSGIPEDEQDWELSMGMSADFEVAVKEGSGSVRVGTRIFGERPKKVKAGDGEGVTK